MKLSWYGCTNTVTCSNIYKYSIKLWNKKCRVDFFFFKKDKHCLVLPYLFASDPEQRAEQDQILKLVAAST